MTEPNAPINRRDAATSARLARLAAVPVDTTRLERRLSGLMADRERPGPVDGAAAWPETVHADRAGENFRGRGRGRGWRAAASVMLVAGVMALLLWGARPDPAVASPLALSQLHAQVVSGRIALVAVDSVSQANRRIADQLAGAPVIPGLPDAQVQSCCLAQVQGRLVAVVLLRDPSGAPITLVVARGRDFAVPMGTPIQVNGKTVYPHAVGEVNMVMANAGDLWLCVMGQVPTPALTTVAGGVDLSDR